MSGNLPTYTLDERVVLRRRVKGQYIPRVSRRRIAGMSNTMHTFMHALQVRWR